ncbi:hypothetical protein JMJ35_007667 [Cladonia borealis]|uniref:Uncharacterized protein n=1 Tax=Cladonia borealis TaxID=184061 RepID=A0AA39QW51_9LECA|nr:hypothetical protein JMJ35_007667 [Cladonia borealis]
MDSINFEKLSSEPGLFVPPADPGNPFFEIWRDGSKHVVREGYLPDKEVEDWVNQSGRFEISSPSRGNVCRNAIRLIFGRPRPPVWRTASGRAHDHGHFYSFVLPFRRATFNMLLDRCKLSQRILDLKEHRAVASHSADYVVQDDDSGSVDIQRLIRIHNDTAIMIAYSFDANTGTTTGLVLQADEFEVKTIKEHITYHQKHIGHQLLLRTVITDMSLILCVEHLADAKQDVMDIEHSTGQHIWDNYNARDENPKPDVELSRVAHGTRIQVAVVCRRIEAVTVWIDLLLEGLIQGQTYSAHTRSMLQWARNMKTRAQMAKFDVDLLGKRAENQVGAVYNRFAQRDNITTQKISAATNRDSAAMKSLAVLGALFFPGTFVATLFSMNSLKDQPFWMYWVITTPLTCIVLGAWVFWTHWRDESVKEQELKLDEKAIG